MPANVAGVAVYPYQRNGDHMDIPEHETESWIFGSGFGQYSWWRDFYAAWRYDDDVHAPDGWVWTVTVEHPERDEWACQDIDHAALMRVFALIRDGGGGEYVSKACRENCESVFTDPGSCDFDADTADQVVQVAILGGVHYG